jgi:hypothetical protein
MKPFARLVSVNLGLITVAIVAAELVFGNWIFGPNFGALNLPRNEKRVFDASQFIPGATRVLYTRDSYGFRGPSPGTPERVDVIVLGGSTTNERFVGDDDTWVARLQENFRKAGTPLVFGNASVDGQTSIGHIAALDQWLSKLPGLKPRHALVYIGINDATLGPDEIKQFDAMMSPQRSRRLRQYVMNHSALYNLYRTVRGSLRARDAHLMHGARLADGYEWRPVGMRADPEALRAELRPRLDAYGERLVVLTKRLQAMGAEPIFVTQRRGDAKVVDGVLHRLVPRGNPTAPGDRDLQMLSLFNTMTLAHCARSAVACVDIESNLAMDAEDFYDGIHTTPSGSKKIGDFLYGELKTKLSQ